MAFPKRQSCVCSTLILVSLVFGSLAFLCHLHCSYLASDLFQIALPIPRNMRSSGPRSVTEVWKKVSLRNVLGRSRLRGVRQIKAIRSVKRENISWVSKNRLRDPDIWSRISEGLLPLH